MDKITTYQVKRILKKWLMKITLLFSELMMNSSLPLVNGIYLTLQCLKIFIHYWMENCYTVAEEITASGSNWGHLSFIHCITLPSIMTLYETVFLFNITRLKSYFRITALIKELLNLQFNSMESLTFPHFWNWKMNKSL